jgi:hypothetical protein
MKRRRTGQKEMAITQGKMPFVFGMVVLATLLIAAPAAHAACRSPKNICRHFDDCLQRTSDPNNKDADGIRAGVKARNGQIVLAGAEACARDLDRKQQWDKWARPRDTISASRLAEAMTNSSRAGLSRRRIRRMELPLPDRQPVTADEGVASVIAQAPSGTPLSVFVVVVKLRTVMSKNTATAPSGEHRRRMDLSANAQILPSRPCSPRHSPFRQ